MPSGKFEMLTTAQPQKTTVVLNGDNGDITAGGNGQPGIVSACDGSGWARIVLNAGNENMLFRGETKNGVIGPLNIKLAGGNSSMTLMIDDKDRMTLNGAAGTIFAGGNGAGGNLALFNAGNTTNNGDTNAAMVHLSDAHLVMRNAAGARRVLLDGPGANLWLGGNGQAGDIMLFESKESIPDSVDKANVWISGENGDIVLRNADCAEEFDICDPQEVQPGCVMVLAEKGCLRQSTEAYDRKVAGIISGAGEYKPGLVLDRKRSPRPRLPLALMGKVFCKVDAGFSPIDLGDLLTTSPTPGHAMKATNRRKAFGAVIGKALGPLRTGQGLIPVLIALQ